MTVQIFGVKKCAETRKAERWWKERGAKIQLIDLKEKGMSPGELKAVAQKTGGLYGLIARDSARFKEKGLHVASYAGAMLEKIVLEDPLLLPPGISRTEAAFRKVLALFL